MTKAPELGIALPHTGPYATPEGIVQVGGNPPAVAYGALVSTFEPYPESGRQPTLAVATNQLIRELQRSNPNLRVTDRGHPARLRPGRAAM